MFYKKVKVFSEQVITYKGTQYISPSIFDFTTEYEFNQFINILNRKRYDYTILSSNSGSGSSGSTGGDVDVDEIITTVTNNVLGNTDTKYQRKIQIKQYDPSQLEDFSKGHVVGSRWINTETKNEFICLDTTENAQVWVELENGKMKIADMIDFYLPETMINGQVIRWDNVQQKFIMDSNVLYNTSNINQANIIESDERKFVTPDLNVTINNKQNKTDIGTTIAPLANGKIPFEYLPLIQTSNTYVVPGSTQRLALTNIVSGDQCFETTTKDIYVYDGQNWIRFQTHEWANINLDYDNITNKPSIPTVEQSQNNGYVRINGVEVGVYSHPLNHNISDVLNLQSELDGKALTSDIVTINNNLNDKQDKINTYTKTEVDDLIQASTGTDLSDYYTKSQVDTEIDTKIGNIPQVDLTPYYNKTETDSKIDEKIQAIEFPTTDLSDYYNKAQVDNEIDTKISQIPQTDLSNYYTKAETTQTVNNAIINLNMSQYYNKTETDSKIDEKIALIPQTDLSNYYEKSAVDTLINNLTTELNTLKDKINNTLQFILLSNFNIIDSQTEVSALTDMFRFNYDIPDGETLPSDNITLSKITISENGGQKTPLVLNSHDIANKLLKFDLSLNPSKSYKISIDNNALETYNGYFLNKTYDINFTTASESGLTEPVDLFPMYLETVQTYKNLSDPSWNDPATDGYPTTSHAALDTSLFTALNLGFIDDGSTFADQGQRRIAIVHIGRIGNNGGTIELFPSEIDVQLLKVGMDTSNPNWIIDLNLTYDNYATGLIGFNKSHISPSKFMVLVFDKIVTDAEIQAYIDSKQSEWTSTL